MSRRVDALENQAAARAEVEQAVVKLAIAQQQRQRQLDAITAAPVVEERDAIMAEPWFPNQGLRP